MPEYEEPYLPEGVIAEPAAPSRIEPEPQPASEPPPEQAALTAQLAHAERIAQENRENWLRARADTENMRKRMQTEVANAHKYAIDNFSTELLAVKDALEAAVNIESTTLDDLRNGVELTLRQLSAVFQKFTIVEIDPIGQMFDPHKHQAMTLVEFDAAPNTVVQVMQKGYQLNDRVIRPALVMVAK